MLFVDIEKQLPHFLLRATLQVNNEIVVLSGPSGAGKSSILNSIAGLTSPDSGTISLNETLLYEENKTDLPIQKRHIGYVFQDYALFPHMTVWKNIAYAIKDESFIKQLLQELGINHLTDKYPHEISGGEKQRVALARAIAAEPKLLLLDEPFSALDDDTRTRSHEQLIHIHKRWRIPIILVTHSKDEARKLAHRVLHMKDGTIYRTEQIKESS
ncbi:MAG TPA: ATP-binding cassette domain-containing protein [Bacillota bacterium]|nr:ATP-binding cassette domain-containing protein [Bacillota bacterium]